MLRGKHIILGVTGGIAAYKSAILARLLVKAGAEVQPVMTPAAREFITPLTLSTLTGKPVITDFFTRNTGEWHSHVDLGLWADAMVVAPCTACTLAKMATGLADNMLVTTYLSARCPVWIAPAMDLDMMAHPTTSANLTTLRSHGVHIIEAATGELASHLEGKGRMEEPQTIVDILKSHFATGAGTLKGVKMLVTAGPTYEKIDPVRFIGNYSSGKMGYAIAEEAARRGASVTLVSGPVSLSAPAHPAITTVKVESARQMLDACLEAWPECQVGVMSAAVADFAPSAPATSKIKRESPDAPASIALTPNPDIAATLGRNKQPGQQLVGFALETATEPMALGAAKLKAKNLDMIVVNSLADEGAGFMTDTNKVTILTAAGRQMTFPLKSKADVACDILDALLKG